MVYVCTFLYEGIGYQQEDQRTTRECLGRDRCSFGFEVSHPFRKKPRKGWGTRSVREGRYMSLGRGGRDQAVYPKLTFLFERCLFFVRNSPLVTHTGLHGNHFPQ